MGHDHSHAPTEIRHEKPLWWALGLTATFLLAVMLTSVHIREVVQFCVYLGCFLAVILVVPRLRAFGRRAMLLLGVVVSVAAIYTVWHARVAPFVAGLVDGERARLTSRFASGSIRELVFGPLSDSPLSDFVPNFELVWTGLTPFFLFAGPTVILLFRHQPLVWLVSSSTLMYLAVMSIPRWLAVASSSGVTAAKKRSSGTYKRITSPADSGNACLSCMSLTKVPLALPESVIRNKPSR